MKLTDLMELDNNDWTKTDDGWATEASALMHVGNTVQCPSCHSVVQRGRLKPSHDREGELSSWVGFCPKCNAKLTIFND